MHLLPQQAVFFAELVIAEHPESDEAAELLAETLLRHGEAGRARDLLQERQPLSQKQKYLLAMSYCRLQSPEEAEPLLEELLSDFEFHEPTESPDSIGPALFLLGQAKEDLGKSEQALIAYSKCLELCPFMWCAFEQLSKLSYRAFRYLDPGALFSNKKLAINKVLHPESADALSPKRCSTPGSGPTGPLQRKRRCSNTGTQTPKASFRGDLKKPCAGSPLMESAHRAMLSRGVTNPLSPCGPKCSPRGAPAKKLMWLRNAPQRSTNSSSLGTPCVTSASPRGQLWASTGMDGDQVSLSSMLTRLGVAFHYLQGFELPEALRALQELPKKLQSRPFVQDMMARCFFEMAEYGRAAEIYSHCCRKFPHFKHLGLEYFSSALWHLKDSVELAFLAQRCLEWGRDRPQVWCAIGNCFSLQSEHEQAIRCFRRAIQLDPNFAYAYTLMGHEYMAREDIEKATEMYETATSIDSRHYNAWWGLGNLWVKQEDLCKAKYHFQKAVDINGFHTVLRSSLGKVYQALGEPERALKLFSQGGSVPCTFLAAYDKGCALASLGRSAEAVQELRKAQGLEPKEPLIHLQLGRAYASCGDPHRAFSHFTMATHLCDRKGSNQYQGIISAQIELLNSVSDLEREEMLVTTPTWSEVVLDRGGADSPMSPAGSPLPSRRHWMMDSI